MEYRQVKKGRKIFFCSLSCSSHHRNSKRKDLVKKITKKCPVCKNQFDTCTGKHERFFCSRSCASKGSMTTKRIQKARESGLKNKQNLISVNDTLKMREKWKYESIEKYLKEKEIEYELEYPMDSFVFDLAILKNKMLFEFDGTYHNGKQLLKDSNKDNMARKYGWKIIRISTPPNAIIDSDLIKGFI